MTAKVKTIRSSWWEGYGYRLDCQPYLAGALETKIILEGLALRKDRLGSLTQGPNGGIFHAGREKRLWVDSPEFGVPFLGSTDILAADLSCLPLISKKQVEANPLLLIQKGYSLITRSGTIGRIAYARPEMDGLACSEHVLRVCSDPEKIPPGYLYAFLSSKFGIPLVVSGTYGSIIQEIEPEHLAGIPVPRLDPQTEMEIHELVEKAAELRTEASILRSKAVKAFEDTIGWGEFLQEGLSSVVGSTTLGRRLDAFRYSPKVQEARAMFSRYKCTDILGNKVEAVFSPNIMARQKVEDTDYGVPFLSSSAVFRVSPEVEYFISKSTPSLNTFIIEDRDVLIPRSGSLGGVIGHAVLPHPACYGWAATEHLVRVRCHSSEDAFYFWAVLASEPGYWAVLGTAFGSAIPSLDEELVAQLRIPIVANPLREELVSLVGVLVKMAAQALESEKKALSITETAIGLKAA